MPRRTEQLQPGCGGVMECQYSDSVRARRGAVLIRCRKREQHATTGASRVTCVVFDFTELSLALTFLQSVLLAGCEQAESQYLFTLQFSK